MGERIHSGDAGTGEGVVRALLRLERPELAGRRLRYLRASGTDNAMWRAGDVVVRLPRHAGAAGRLDAELRVLDALVGAALSVRVPSVRHVGGGHDGVFPFGWAVLDRIDGVDACADPRTNAAAFMDVDAVLGIAREGLEVPPAAAPVFLHGDLIPGNLLLDGRDRDRDRDRRIAAVIDWGMAGWGDPAQDLAPAWAVLGDAGRRRAFREALGVDDATWIRGRTIELVHAVVAVVCYVPMGHPLGDVMARSLGRIVADR